MQKIKSISVVAILVILGLFIYDLFFIYGIPNIGKTALDYLGDIRAMNNYLQYLLIILSILILTVDKIIQNPEKKQKVVSLFLIAIVTGVLSIIFFPIPWLAQTVALAKLRWLFSLILEQATVVLIINGVFVALNSIKDS
ncbi:hypothetical protein ACFL2K_02600 [Candidatus Margulisiibacteriota bacterium]